MSSPKSGIASWSCFSWQCWRRWRECLLVSAVVTYGALTLVVLPLIIALMVQNSPQFMATFIATFFVLVTLPISLANLLQHAVNYTNPELQTYLCRMILAVPVYSISSLFAVALVNYGVAPYMEFILQVYEAFALYMFYAFCVKYLYQTYGTETEEVLKKQKPARHMLSCLFTCPVGKKFVDLCRIGVLQFLFIKPLMALIQLITEIYGVYGDTLFSLRTAYFYVSVGNFFTIFTALYALLAFYRGTKALLEPVKPLTKLIAIKAIVFIPFVQNIVLSVLVKAKAIPKDMPGSGDDEDEALTAWANYGFPDASSTLSSLIVTFEMFFVALVYYRAFSHRPYKRTSNSIAAVPMITFLLRVFNLTDLLWDTTSTIQGLCEKPASANEREMEAKYHEAKGLLPYSNTTYRSGDESSDAEYDRSSRVLGPPSQAVGVAVVSTYNGNVLDDVPLVDEAEK